jgi:hypothetical protein
MHVTVALTSSTKPGTWTLKQSTRDGMTQIRADPEAAKARIKQAEGRLDTEVADFVARSYWSVQAYSIGYSSVLAGQAISAGCALVPCVDHCILK